MNHFQVSTFALIAFIASCAPPPSIHDEGTPVTDEIRSAYIKGNYRVPTYIPKMDYPPISHIGGVESFVVLVIDIGPDGSVLNPTITSSSNNYELDSYAISWVKLFRFEKASETTSKQPQKITFELHD